MDKSNIKLIASKILYHIGDLYSYFMMATGIGYWFYQKVMLLSCDLDNDGVIWKKVKVRSKYKKRLTGIQKNGSSRSLLRTRPSNSYLN